MIYHQRSTDTDERMKQFLTDADKLLALCESDYNDSTEYDLFVDVYRNRLLLKMKAEDFA